MKIYGDTQSGNCYKIKLLCSFLQIEQQWQFFEQYSHEPDTQATSTYEFQDD